MSHLATIFTLVSTNGATIITLFFSKLELHIFATIVCNIAKESQYQPLEKGVPPDNPLFKG